MSCGPADQCPGKCVYNVPCCGGFCAPTENPDESCFRHVSNEWTVPGGAGGTGPLGKVLPCCETSCCCRMVGKVGISFGSRNRKCFMLCGVLINIIFIILNIIGVLAINEDANTLKQFSWLHGKAPEYGWESYLGVSSRVHFFDCSQWPNPDTCATTMLNGGNTHDGGTTYMHLQNFADEGCSTHRLNEAAENQVISKAMEQDVRAMADQCENCKSNLLTSFSLIFGIITTLPNIMTDLQRTTPFGDINCQATAGGVMTIFSTVMNVMSLSNFAKACKESAPTEMIGFDGKTVKIEWSYGPGFVCVLIATFLRFIDALSHLLVPTPEARWTKPSPTPANALEYLKLATPPQESMSDAGATKVGAGQV